MPNKITHLSDQDLVMASDGELAPRRRAEVRAHLDVCRSCRERMRSLETAAAEFVRARRRNVDPQLPAAAGPEALFRARLAEAAPSTSRSARLPWKSFLSHPTALRGLRAEWRLAPAAAVFFAVLAALPILFEATVSAEGPKPKAGLTPGETRPITIDEVCRTSQAVVITPNITDETRREVFAAYRIDPARRGEFEVDYLITPDLGGAESVRNMWPQPYSVRWNARVKDKLEQRLHQLVCENKLDLTTAQHDIALDWIGAYKKYVGTVAPH
jgi:hypothetical protein